jgi:hypothetical protein
MSSFLTLSIKGKRLFVQHSKLVQLHIPYLLHRGSRGKGAGGPFPLHPKSPPSRQFEIKEKESLRR